MRYRGPRAVWLARVNPNGIFHSRVLRVRNGLEFFRMTWVL